MFSTVEAWKAAMIKKGWAVKVVADAWSWVRNLVCAPAAVTPPVQKPCDHAGCDGTMIFDDAKWPSYAWICERDPAHRQPLYVDYGEWHPIPVKRCIFAGCAGVMSRNDAHRAFWIVKWECDRGGHRELLVRDKCGKYRRGLTKDCPVAGCHGVLGWNAGTWICFNDSNHLQPDTQPTSELQDSEEWVEESATSS